jgi:hypothetical protein
MAASMMTALAIKASGSRQSLRDALRMVPMLQRDGHYVLIDAEGVAGSLDEADARDLAGRLSGMAGYSFGGGTFVSDGDNNILLDIEGNDSTSSIQYVVKGDWNFTPPDAVKTLMLTAWSSVASLWKQAA